MESLYNYYETTDIRPTHASFNDEEQLNRYAEQRKNFFYRLNLPYTFFDTKKLLEFGPDTGENALVFAKWNSTITMVEPIMDAHRYIRNYFSKFNLENSINELSSATLLEFKSEAKFDIIDAEGFIYTIQPNSAWIKKAKECLVADGLFILSFYDLFGGFFELFQKAIYKSVTRSGKYENGIESAKLIFLNKWNSVQHTRKIESWFMDVIENPFVRLKYFIDPVNLLKDMHDNKMRLYSSWPVFRDPLSVDWIKKPFTPEEELNSSVNFIKKSRLSHFLGKECFINIISDALDNHLQLIVELTDSLIDNESKFACENAIVAIDKIVDFIEKYRLYNDVSEITDIKNILKMIKIIFNLMAKSEVDDLVKFCQQDKVFLKVWGSPNCNIIFQNS